MQLYFDQDDAELEFEALVTKTSSKAGMPTDGHSGSTTARRILDIAGLSVVLGVATILLTAHL